MHERIIKRNKWDLIGLRCCIIINVTVLFICVYNTGVSWISMSSGIFTVGSIVGYFVTSKLCSDIENMLKGANGHEQINTKRSR